jgi:long-chain acyl-CoA synthetase
VWVFDDGIIDQLKEDGRNVSDADLEARRGTLTPDSVATIIYTSGTTGRPKGCTLTHRNFMFEVDNVVNGLPDVFLTPGSSTLLFLPVAHVFGRAIQLGCIRAGVRLGHSADIKQLLPGMQSFQPTFLLAVPRVFEKIYNSSQQKAVADGKGKIFDSAAQVAIDYSTSLDEGGPGIVLKLKHAVFDKLVYSKLRHAMGGQMRWAVSGGAPLGARLGHFFRGINVTILEGYGLTETSAATTVNRADAIRIGTVGQPLPGAKVKVAADGELMLGGDQIFIGYWNNPTATAEAIEPDGWFHSGDIGEIDDDGFVRITGRKKELIVTAAGKNVAPAVLEDRLRANWLVSQCMVVGDGQPFIAALITIDPEAFPAWAKQNDKGAATVADLVNDPDLTTAIQLAVDDANKAVSHAEAIKKFAILPVDWTEEGGQITPSLKLKRNVVMNEFATDVAALYS